MDQTWERVHRALIELSYERGFRRLSVEDVCGRAGISREQFDARYSDLQDCFAQTLEACAEEFLARLDDAYAVAGPWQDRLRSVAHATLEHIEEDPARAHFTIAESFNGGERAELVRERVFARLSGYVDDGRHQAGARPSATNATAEAINGAVFRQMRLAIESNRGSFEELIPELMYVAVLPYLGREAAERELDR
jgi:AcrR family transcriptional regulator